MGDMGMAPPSGTPWWTPLPTRRGLMGQQPRPWRDSLLRGRGSARRAQLQPIAAVAWSGQSRNSRCAPPTPARGGPSGHRVVRSPAVVGDRACPRASPRSHESTPSAFRDASWRGAGALAPSVDHWLRPAELPPAVATAELRGGRYCRRRLYMSRIRRVKMSHPPCSGSGRRATQAALR